MVKVVREVCGTTRCASCRSLLDYEWSDVFQTTEENHETGKITVRSFIKCPTCLCSTRAFEDFVYNRPTYKGDFELRREDIIDLWEFDVMKYRASIL